MKRLYSMICVCNQTGGDCFFFIIKQSKRNDKSAAWHCNVHIQPYLSPMHKHTRTSQHTQRHTPRHHLRSTYIHTHTHVVTKQIFKKGGVYTDVLHYSVLVNNNNKRKTEVAGQYRQLYKSILVLCCSFPMNIRAISQCP